MTYKDVMDVLDEVLSKTEEGNEELRTTLGLDPDDPIVTGEDGEQNEEGAGEDEGVASADEDENAAVEGGNIEEQPNEATGESATGEKGGSATDDKGGKGGPGFFGKGGTLDKGWQSAKAAGKDALTTAKDFAKRNPKTALGIAAGTGLAAGVLGSKLFDDDDDEDESTCKVNEDATDALKGVGTALDDTISGVGTGVAKTTGAIYNVGKEVGRGALNLAGKGVDAIKTGVGRGYDFVTGSGKSGVPAKGDQGSQTAKPAEQPAKGAEPAKAAAKSSETKTALNDIDRIAVSNKQAHDNAEAGGVPAKDDQGSQTAKTAEQPAKDEEAAAAARLRYLKLKEKAARLEAAGFKMMSGEKDEMEALKIKWGFDQKQETGDKNDKGQNAKSQNDGNRNGEEERGSGEDNGEKQKDSKGLSTGAAIGIGAGAAGVAGLGAYLLGKRRGRKAERRRLGAGESTNEAVKVPAALKEISKNVTSDDGTQNAEPQNAEPQNAEPQKKDDTQNAEPPKDEPQKDNTPKTVTADDGTQKGDDKSQYQTIPGADIDDDGTEGSGPFEKLGDNIKTAALGGSAILGGAMLGSALLKRRRRRR